MILLCIIGSLTLGVQKYSKARFSYFNMFSHIQTFHTLEQTGANSQLTATTPTITARWHGNLGREMLKYHSIHTMQLITDILKGTVNQDKRLINIKPGQVDTKPRLVASEATIIIKRQVVMVSGVEIGYNQIKREEEPQPQDYRILVLHRHGRLAEIERQVVVFVASRRQTMRCLQIGVN